MGTMRYLAGSVALGAALVAAGCVSTMSSMDPASMAKGSGCCGMCAMMTEKSASMGGMIMPAKPQGGGLLPPTEKSAAGPSCGEGGCGGGMGEGCCCSVMKKG